MSALSGTVAAMYWPVEEKGSAAIASAESRPGSPRMAPPADSGAPMAGQTGEEGLWEPAKNDPFAPRGWQAAAPVPAAAAMPVQTLPAAAPPPAGPPALPFQFVGQFMDGDQQLVYLGHGEQMLIAKNGEVLEQTYKVLNVGQTQIEFEHLPTGVRQLMPLPAQEH
ncbi:hypothetical protein [Pseudoduganella violacea]|uniref:Secretion system X translation initiation factor n=1 Tax=Pseudoduganella violacea TaxID=1715466 RepID=A0A7W5BE91_9BURK|nr:hypothetical protein [Pseudoduganella violacea]MBB3121524.1 hypothetical protein [Pseudoduganella violacea]